MAPILYKKDVSPPCRAVLLTAKAIELELLSKDLDLQSKEHLEPEYVQMNPQHTVPLLDDDGFILCDSHTIITYLVSKYGPDDSLYPVDLQQRGLIDHKLYFDAGVLQSLLRQIVGPIFFGGETTVPEKLIDSLNEAYGFMEAFLNDHEWFVGDSVTLADLSLIPTVTSLNIIVPVDAETYPQLSAWLSRIEELPYYEANASGLEAFKNIYESLIA